jgi:lipopolysaccharide biosynthesis glycosyltransferase
LRPPLKDDGMKNDLLGTLADSNYVDKAKQLFSSVYWNAGWKGDYMLLAYDIPEKDLKWFKDKGILVRECEPVITKSDRPIGHAPLTTLCKFYLFTPEFKQWKNIVFLDGDIIVRGSLDTLAQVKGFGAIRILNIFLTTLRGQFHNRNRNTEHLFQELERKCDLSRPAFNSGVMAFSTDSISEGDLQTIKNLFFHFKDILFISEETVLNLYFYDTWQELSQIYNMCPSYEIFHSGCGPDNLKTVVSHTYSNFRGGKPWNPKSPLHPEWKSNLDKADLIDLANPKPAKRIVSKEEEAHDDVYLKNLHQRYFYKFYRYKINFLFRFYFNRLKMRAGTFLMNHYPQAYLLQKKLRNRP